MAARAAGVVGAVTVEESKVVEAKAKVEAETATEAAAKAAAAWAAAAKAAAEATGSAAEERGLGESVEDWMAAE